MMLNFFGHKMRIITVWIFFAVIMPLNLLAGDYPKDVFDSLAFSVRTMPDDIKKYDVMQYLAVNHPDLDMVEQYSIMAFRLAKKLGRKDLAANSADIVGWCKYHKKQFLEAGKYYKDAIFFHKLAGDSLGRANSIMCMGNVYFALGDYVRGLDTAMYALRLFAQEADSAKVGMVYRGIANSCIDFQLYKTAENYFVKAMDLDTRIGSVKNLARDYYGIGLCISNEARIYDTLKKNIAKDYFLKAKCLSEETSDYLYLVNENCDLALLYAELSVLTGDWNFADSSVICYEACKKYIEMMNLKEFDDKLEIVKASHSVLAGNYDYAFNVLDSFARKPGLTKVLRQMLSQVSVLLFFSTQNYQRWFEYIEDEIVMRNRLYVSEYGVKLDVLSSNTDIDIFISRYDGALKDNDRFFNEEREHYEFVMLIWIIIISGSCVIIALLVYYFIKDRKRNKILLEQREEILSANTELAQLNLEITVQSEELQTQTEEIQRQKNSLSLANANILNNLESAGQLQQSIVPSKAFMKELFENSFVLWRPLDIVSGDFYWATKIGGLKFVAVADCTGHGVPGACLSMLGTAVLNGVVAKINSETVNAALMLDLLRNRFVTALSSAVDGEKVHDGLDIALCIFNPKEKMVSYAGAYRPLWILKDGAITEIKPDRMPIALDKDHIGNFSDHEIPIEGRETFYMFSDGIIDQFGKTESGRETKFQSRRLKELLVKIGTENADFQRCEIEKTIDNWSNGVPQTDDILLIGISTKTF